MMPIASDKLSGVICWSSE